MITEALFLFNFEGSLMLSPENAGNKIPTEIRIIPINNPPQINGMYDFLVSAHFPNHPDIKKRIA
ncbi:hypothetical protein JIY74_33590 [Vibrio harveyi]|nr:hypothetical protein [Vibrio harveyi]